MSAATPNTCEDTYTGAIRLMRAFFPELANKRTMMEVKSEYPFEADGPLLSFYIQVAESDQLGRIVASPYSNPSSAERVGSLSAHFQFDGRDYRIFSIFTSGSLVNSEKRQTLEKSIDEHPDWSETQMTEALLAAGAKFGPNQKEALLASFPFKELKPIVGEIKMDWAKFAFRGNDKEPPLYASVNWSIRFRATKDGKIDEYTLILEPFAGKVISFGRRPIK